MSKFCKNCGVPLKEGARFCSECGTKITAPKKAPAKKSMAIPAIDLSPARCNANAENSATATPVSNIKKINKVKIIGIAIAVLAVIASIVAIVLFSFGNTSGKSLKSGPETVVEKALNAVMKGKAKTLVTTIPPFVFTDEDAKNEIIDELDNMLDDAELDDIEFEIRDVSKMSSSDRDSLMNDLEYYKENIADFDIDDITDFKTVKVRIDDGDDRINLELDLIRYKGKWYIWNFANLLVYIQQA